MRTALGNSTGPVKDPKGRKNDQKREKKNCFVNRDVNHSADNETRASYKDAARICIGRHQAQVGNSLSVIIPRYMDCPIVVIGEVSRAHRF